jgi:hypothetical protein
VVYLSDGVVLKKQNNTSEIGCEEVGVRPVAACSWLKEKKEYTLTKSTKIDIEIQSVVCLIT